MFNGGDIGKVIEAQAKLIGCLTIFATIGAVALVIAIVWFCIYIWNHVSITIQ